MNEEKFESLESVRYWMDSLLGSDGVGTTKYQWKLRLSRFCEWLGKTPDELIMERKEDMKNEDLKVRYRTELYVKRFLRFLERQALSPNKRRTYFTAVNSFYHILQHSVFIKGKHLYCDGKKG